MTNCVLEYLEIQLGKFLFRHCSIFWSWFEMYRNLHKNHRKASTDQRFHQYQGLPHNEPDQGQGQQTLWRMYNPYLYCPLSVLLLSEDLGRYLLEEYYCDSLNNYYLGHHYLHIAS